MPNSDSNAGRPLKFQDLEELESKIDAYFKEWDREEDTRQYKHGETFEWIEDDEFKNYKSRWFTDYRSIRRLEFH